MVGGTLIADRATAFRAGTLAAAVAAGLTGAGALLALYFGIVSWANSPEHARRLLGDNWYFVVPIAAGFGLQIAMFAYLRLALRAARKAAGSTALTAAGTGASSAAMVACCAHHLADVLPVIGISGAAVFLDDQRVPIMAAGLAINAVAAVYMATVLRQQVRAVRAPIWPERRRPSR